MLLRRLRPGVRRSTQATPHQGALLFERLVRRYTHLGYPRAGNLTAREYVALLASENAPDLEVARAVLTHYEAARFAAQPTDGETSRRLRKQIAAVRAPSR